jgi:hypothetical protein
MLEADLYQQINMMEVAIDKLQEALELEPNEYNISANAKWIIGSFGSSSSASCNLSIATSIILISTN